MRNNKWEVVYEEAINENGELFFPTRLTREFLDEARQKMGSMLFANQYLNQIFPAEDAKFKKEWIKYYETMPSHVWNFAFIDPAISTEDGADYTGIVVISVDELQNWYIRLAQRRRLSPTDIVNLCYQLHKEYKLMGLGIEVQAYQKALVYMIHEQSTRHSMVLPIKEINQGPLQTKEMRILGLVPRFEFGRIYMQRNQDDLTRELLQFPRSAHDDICDALSSMEQIVFYPSKQEKPNYEPNPHSPEYERNIIKGYVDRANEEYETGNEGYR